MPDDTRPIIARNKVTGLRCCNACNADSEYKVMVLRCYFYLCPKCMKGIVDGYADLQVGKGIEDEPVPDMRTP